MLTREQLKTLHAMFGKLKKLRPDIYDDAWLRLCLRNAGKVKPDCTGHVSTKSLTNFGLEDVLDIVEQELDRHGQNPGTYWRDTVARRRGYASRRQIHAIYELASPVPYPLRTLCLKFSDGRNGCPEKLTPMQAQQLIEMMKEVAARAKKMPAGGCEGGGTTGGSRGRQGSYHARATRQLKSQITTGGTMQLAELQAILADCRYLDWKFEAGQAPYLEHYKWGQNFWLRVTFSVPNGGGEPTTTWNGRRWLVSGHASRSEVVQTAFLAVKTAIEHELREAFHYRGAAIFGPHFNSDKLVSLCQRHDALDIREDHRAAAD